MQKISHRLLTIAKLVPKNKTVYDIGCDHGYLDIYLTKHNRNYCYLVDVDVSKAYVNIDKEHLNNQVSIVKSDGLSLVNPSKEDVTILSGLGSKNIISILKSDLSKLTNTIIIQSNNNIPWLRKEMYKLAYHIENEKYLVDKNRHYVILSFQKGHQKYRYVDLFIGPFLKKDINYINYLKKYYERLIKQVPILKKINILIKLFILKHYNKNYTKKV